MAGERDVLAAMRTPPPLFDDGRPNPNGYEGGWHDAIEEALARLAAPSPEPLPREALDRDGETEPCPTCWQPVPVPQRGDHDYGIPLLAATPPAESLPREALDVERLAHAIAGVTRGGHQLTERDREYAKSVAREYAALSPDRPTPRDGGQWDKPEVPDRSMDPWP